MLDALRRAHARGARLLTVCSGAYALAHAGLLDGLRATTHWMHADDLARQFPEVDVDPNVLYVDTGQIMTSAGTAAGIDLLLHVVRLDHGADVANAVARRMVVPPHRDGGQAQFVEAPVPEDEGIDPMAVTLDWALTHLDRPLTVELLARKALTSPRTFARRFRAVTGTTPLQWLLRQRILHAQRLLETTDLPVEIVAQRCGFGSASVLRTHFKRLLDTSPGAYRRMFRREDAVSA
jgi:transcriptional regulator GlxA family with amidase domain